MNAKEREFKIALAKKGWTQAKLAEEMGVTRATVTSFLRTLKAGKPQSAVVDKYAKALGIPVEKLM